MFLLLLGTTALAQEASPSPAPTDLTASHQYYDLGVEAYEKGDYAAALRAFEAAWAEAPNPELQFNMARCHERLFQWEAAAESYETYLNAKKSAADAYEIKARIAELRRRAYETQHPAPAPAASPSDRGYRAGAVATLAIAVGLGGGGAGAYLSAWSEYSNKRSACAGKCAPESLDGLRTRVQTAEAAGAVLFTLAGVAVIADFALWVLDARARRH
jgi:tetratricopeptide (TPR) repeat protein